MMYLSRVSATCLLTPPPAVGSPSNPPGAELANPFGVMSSSLALLLLCLPCAVSGIRYFVVLAASVWVLSLLTLALLAGADFVEVWLELDFELLALATLMVSHPSSFTTVSMGDLFLGFAARARSFALLISLGLGRNGLDGSSEPLGECCSVIVGMFTGRGGKGGRDDFGGTCGESCFIDMDLFFLGVATGLLGPLSSLGEDDAEL